MRRPILSRKDTKVLRPFFASAQLFATPMPPFSPIPVMHLARCYDPNAPVVNSILRTMINMAGGTVFAANVTVNRCKKIKNCDKNRIIVPQGGLE